MTDSPSNLKISPPKTAGEELSPLLGSTCEITRRFTDFADFWQKEPVSARFALQSQSRHLLAGQRVGNCLRLRTDRTAPVDVLHAPAVNKAHFGNLQTCGSVWMCPVCAAKIATRRREELGEVVSIWQGRGYSVLLATFTLQHTIDELCIDVLNGLCKSFSEFWECRRGRKIKKDYRIAGRVRGLETTYTRENGWHIHFHVLFFVQGVLPASGVERLRSECSEHWQAVLSLHNRYADSIHGVDLKDANRDIAEYVAKHGEEDMAEAVEKIRTWTEAHEVTMGPIKRQTKRGGVTPMQLLAMALCEDEVAGRLFTEYAYCFKGKSHLHWSKGLRKLLGMSAELSDEEIAARQDEKACLLARLENRDWKIILANGARGELLAAAADGDTAKLKVFFLSLGLEFVWINAPGQED